MAKPKLSQLCSKSDVKCNELSTLWIEGMNVRVFVEVIRKCKSYSVGLGDKKFQT